MPLGLPLLLFGGIFSGATTVTEAALLAVVYALVAGVAMGGIRRQEIAGQLAQIRIVTATTLWVLAAASAFAWILMREWVPQTLGEWMAGAGTGRAGVLALTVVVFVVIGALLEGLPALLIFGPILFPISRALASIRCTTGSSSSPQWASRSFFRPSASACQSRQGLRASTSTKPGARMCPIWSRC